MTNRTSQIVLAAALSVAKLMMDSKKESHPSGVFLAGRCRRAFSSANKSGPISGATIQRGKWKDVSGKAMPITVPPAGTAIREMSRTIEESEGHLLEFAASFVT
jgi:hypothetical protein